MGQEVDGNPEMHASCDFPERGSCESLSSVHTVTKLWSERCLLTDVLFQALGFLSPMAPLSFDPVTEAHHSVFSQFPATLLGESDSVYHLSQCYFLFLIILLIFSEEKPAEREPQEGAELNLPDPTR